MSDAISSSPVLSRRGLLGAGVALAAAGAARAEEPAEPLVVYAARHAEKQAGDDPQLTEAGVARATALAHALRDVPLRAVYSTDTRRTRSTAEPVARGHALETTTYEPEAVARTLLALAGSVLVVGHSNTIPALVRALGGELEQAELDGFDDLFVVVRIAGAPARTLVQRLHYGAPSAAGAGMR